VNSLFHPALEPYGWSTQTLPSGTAPARVIRHDGSALTAVTDDGVRALRNHPALDPQPTVGDWLALDPVTDRVVAVLERSGVLMREAAHKHGPQTLAANVDVVLITCGVDRPIKPGRIYRSVAMAWDAGATPVIVLTKANARADASAVDVSIRESRCS
jgi:ribosome biogenesis GTPase / thiamine phosphate phosphatase